VEYLDRVAEAEKSRIRCITDNSTSVLLLGALERIFFKADRNLLQGIRLIEAGTIAQRRIKKDRAEVGLLQ